jgi:transcriptional regulator with XRE-family HTH domain
MRSEADKVISEAHLGLLENLGRNVTVARNAAEMTQATLAKKAGLGRSSIGKIESFNTNDVSLSTVASVAEALGVPAYLLLLGPEDWSRLASIGSLKEMAEEGMARLRKAATKDGRPEGVPAPDVDRLGRQTLSAVPAEKNEAVREIGNIASQILGQDQTLETTEAVSASVSTALGASMLPGLPILNGMIAGILSRK